VESSGRDGPDGVGVAPSSSSSWNSKSSAVRLAVTESGEGMIMVQRMEVDKGSPHSGSSLVGGVNKRRDSYLSHRSIHLFHTSKKVEVADDSFHLVSQRKMMLK